MSEAAFPAVRFEAISVAFGGVVALHDVNLDVAAGDLCVLVGPSGSGKSTMLRLVNRVAEPLRGRVLVRGEDVSSQDAATLRRSIGYVIQSVGLFPHRNVTDNIATVPRLLGWPRERIAERVRAMLALVHLDERSFAHRYPAELSGGQAQRVGLARALAGDPSILLMDEPFGAVDPIVRRDLRSELRRIHGETGKTILLVTHDPAEALELATRIVVLKEGRIAAMGRPLDLAGGGAAGEDSVGERVGSEGFVRDLFGGEVLSLQRLRFTPVSAVMDAALAPSAPTIAAGATLRQALTRMIARRSTILSVMEADGPVGSVTIETLVERHQ